jgi:ABC-2 type transport system ATP-binding protein
LAAATSAAISARGLEKRYKPSKRGLEGIDLEVAEGQTFALLGPNGAGKTTFVKCVLDLIRPTGGSITLFGKSTRDPSSRIGVGFAPEVPSFPDYASGQEVLKLHGLLIGMDPDALERQIPALLEAQDLSDAPKKVKAYSKGMVRRLALALALLGNPKLLVLDEPSADLDPIGRRNVRNILTEQKEKGTTIVLNSHMLSEVERLCDHVAIVNKGRLLASGSIDDLVPQGQDLETVFVEMIAGDPRSSSKTVL